MKRSLVVVLTLLVASAAMADPLSLSASGPAAPAVKPSRATLGNAFDGVQTDGSAAQDFETAYDPYDIWVVSDFTTSQAWNLDAISAVGFANTTLDGSGANFRIYNGLPWAGGVLGQIAAQTVYWWHAAKDARRERRSG